MNVLMRANVYECDYMFVKIYLNMSFFRLILTSSGGMIMKEHVACLCRTATTLKLQHLLLREPLFVGNFVRWNFLTLLKRFRMCLDVWVFPQILEDLVRTI